MAAPSYTKLPPTLTSPPPEVPDVLVSFPSPRILLVTLNRPKQLNAIPRPQHFALAALWDWYDDEPSLRCAVFTGSGRAFCAGADLKEWNVINTGGANPQSLSKDSIAQSGAGVAGPEADQQLQNNGAANGGKQLRRDGPRSRFPPSGFGGVSNRPGKKPIIAAVNGICFGGGMEMAINCDMIIASPKATFGLPEVTIGVIALAGALPRLIRIVGKQRATEMALIGSSYTALKMQEWGLVNEIVQEGHDVVKTAIEWAEKVAKNSPDSVIVSREGLKLGWEGLSAETGTDMLIGGWYAQIEKGDNMVEGVKSFNERRKPIWKDSKL